MLFQLLHQMRGKKADRSYNLAVSIRKHFEGDFQQFDVTEIDLENRLASFRICLLYTSPSPRDQRGSRMPSSA